MGAPTRNMRSRRSQNIGLVYVVVAQIDKIWLHAFSLTFAYILRLMPSRDRVQDFPKTVFSMQENWEKFDKEKGYGGCENCDRSFYRDNSQ